jgi:hypothetical protein
MRHHSWPVGILAITCGLLASTAPARALSSQTWVSGNGSDGGACTFDAPCKTLQFAHGKTSTGGVISVLSSGDFGPVTITRAMSIVADGVEAAILSGAGAAAVTVNVPANATVMLRGLTIDPLGGANSGISFGSGKALHVLNCVIRKAATGIKFSPVSGTSELYISDSVVADSSLNGIDVVPTGTGGAMATLDRVRVENSAGLGITFDGTSTTGSVAGTVRDSVSSGNASVGIYAAEDTTSGTVTTNVMIDRSASVNNRYGIYSKGVDAMIRIGDSTVSGNLFGFVSNDSGKIASYGTNKVDGNGTEVSGTITPVAYR